MVAESFGFVFDAAEAVHEVTGGGDYEADMLEAADECGEFFACRGPLG